MHALQRARLARIGDRATGGALGRAGLAAIAICSAIDLVSLAYAAETEHRDPAQNAALGYWRALYFVPNDCRTTRWEVAARYPLTASMKDVEILLAHPDSQTCLFELRRAANMPYCEWGVPMREKGPNTSTLHLQKSAAPLGLLVFSARREHARGNSLAAVDDLVAAWRLVRFVGKDDSAFGLWAQLRREKTIIEPLAASWVPNLDPAATKQLQREIDRLPKPESFGGLLLKDRDMYLEWLKRILERQGIDQARKEIQALAGDIANKSLGKELVRQTATAPDLFKQIDETSRRYDEAVRIASLPFAGFESAAAEFQGRLASAGPLVRILLLENWGNTDLPLLMVRRDEAEADARLAMLKAAIALRLDGESAFQQIKDPRGAAPFRRDAIEAGYTLTSALPVGGQPITIRFGPLAIDPLREAELIVYDHDANARAKIDDALEQARARHLRVLVQFGFNECNPCYRLHRMLHSTKGLIDGYIHVSIDSTSASGRNLATSFRANTKKGVPHLTVLNDRGEVLANVKPADAFWKDETFDVEALSAFLKKWAPPKEGGK